MARRRCTVGPDKMTAYSKTVADGPEDIRKAALAAFANWNELARRGGGDFGAVTVKMMNEVAAILAGAGDGPFEPQSTEDFAQRIATHHRKTAGLIARVPESARRDADMAARLAFKCGCLYGQAVMQDMWNDPAMVGRDVIDGGRKGHEAAYGDTSMRYGPLVDTFNTLRADGLSITEAQRRAASQHKVTTKTVYRARKWTASNRTHLVVSA